jgi:alpha-beta hydrolase superfamily lysophospholipase
MPCTSKKSSMLLNASDGLELFIHRWTPGSPPKAVVQIAHGMAEHGGRYDRLAIALNAARYTVYANDHRGHGRTARLPEDIGFFAECDGWQKCVDDLWRLNRQISAHHPGLPLILLGQSLGSFMAQHFISEHGDALAAVALSGSSGKPPLQTAAFRAGFAIGRTLLGPRGKSTALTAHIFESFNKRFTPVRTPFDWLTRDSIEVDKYVADPLCAGFQPSMQLAIDVLDGLDEIAQPCRQANIPKELPIYIISGTRDSVGENTKGVEQLLAAYQSAGLERVAHRFYDGARHELFNEINRDHVTRDLIAWLDSIVSRPGHENVLVRPRRVRVAKRRRLRSHGRLATKINS